MASQVPPTKGASFSLALNLYTVAGQLVASPSTLTAQTSKDFSSAFTTASSASVISTVYGLVKIVLDSTQMNGDVINLYVRDESTATVPYTATIYTAAQSLDAVSTQVTAITLSSATVDAVGLANAIWASAVPSTFSTGTAGRVLGDMSSGVHVLTLSDAVWKRSGVLAYGTGAGSSTNTFTLASTTVLGGSNDPTGFTLALTGDTGVGQARPVLSYDSTSKTVTVDRWGTLPSSGAPYTVFATPAASDVSVPSVRVVSMDTNALSASALSTAAVAKMTSGLALAADVSTLASALSSMAGGSTLTAAEAASAVLGFAVDGGYTMAEVLRGVGSVLMGLVSGSSGSTTVFRDLANSKARITAVTDSNGNRTSITLDLT